MIAGKRRSIFKWALIAGVCILIIAGCDQTAADPTQHSDSSDYAAEEQALQVDLSCPKEKTYFDLWLSHYAVLDIDPGNGETIYLKYENPDLVAYAISIDPDGTVSNKGEEVNAAMIDYHGEAKHPNSNDCPVQTFDGSWELKATITGSCANDIVRIHIIEEWVDPVLESDCGDAISPGSGLFSAPELDLTFNLKDKIPSDAVELMGGGPFQASYTYYLWPEDTKLLIDPLVPDSD